MSADLSTVAASLLARLPAAAGFCVKLETPAGALYLQAGSALVALPPGGRADAVVRVSAEDLQALMAGALTFREAVQSGRLVFAGDVSLMPVLEQALSSS